LAICVAIAHLRSSPLPFGMNILAQNAVMIFFIISGFYIAMILNKTYQGAGSTKAFYFSRFFRLWPIYFIITLCAMYASVPLPNSDQNPSALIWKEIADGTMPIRVAIGILFSNFFMFFHDLEYYFSSDISHGFKLIQGFNGGPGLTIYDFVRPGWSLGVEICFYLIAPFIIRNMRAIIIVATTSLLINLYWIHVEAKFEPWRCMFFPSVVYLFMMGAMSYHVFLGGWFRKINWKDVLLVLLMCVVLKFVSDKINADRPVYFAFEPLKFAYYALAIPLLFTITKNWRWDRFVGELSYPLYLSHVLIYSIIIFSGYPETTATGTFALIITLIISVLLVIIIDAPLDKWRHRVAEQLMKNTQSPLRGLPQQTAIQVTSARA
jgi:peptidoglycan/LPS O-acetylase OafA/YrhL